MSELTVPHRNILLGCLIASVVPGVVMSLLLLMNLAPDPLMRPETPGHLLTGLLMTATVAVVLGIVANLVIGFPLLTLLERFRLDRGWIAATAGALVGAAIGGSGFFGGSPVSWAALCGLIGALCGAVAWLTSRPNSTVETDARKSGARGSL